MLQYAEDFFRERIEKEEELKKEKEHEKHSIAGKLNTITEYDYLKAEIRDAKIGISAKLFVMLIIGMLFLWCGITSEIIILTAVYELGVAIVFLPKDLHKLIKRKKEFKQFSKEEVNKLKENEESMKELYEKLEKEITSSQSLIDQYKKELERISVVEEFNDSGAMNQPFYQADTKEEYDLLTKTQQEGTIPFEEFLNERVNYEDVHLGVREIGKKPKYLIRK